MGEPCDMSTYNNPIGAKKEPNMSAGTRISGFPCPPFLAASLVMDESKSSAESERILDDIFGPIS
jgi:hypothetical protein